MVFIMYKLVLKIFRQKAHLPYSALKNQSDDDAEGGPFLPQSDEPPASQLRIWPYVLPWLASTITLAGLCLYLYLQSLPYTEERYSFSRGWKTDFGPSRSAIEIEEVIFTGSPTFAENGTYYVPHPSPINYTADPSPELDRAWDELTWGRYIVVTEQEARDAFEEQYGDIEQFWSPLRGGYITGFDMFHTLHCLNRIRMRFYPEYYPYEDRHVHRVHHLHCLEQIRQYIMCSGDMTPIPTKYNRGRKHSYVDSDVAHTCRNFNVLREWLSARYNGSLAVQPICPGATKPEQGSTSCVLDE